MEETDVRYTQLKKDNNYKLYKIQEKNYLKNFNANFSVHKAQQCTESNLSYYKYNNKNKLHHYTKGFLGSGHNCCFVKRVKRLQTNSFMYSYALNAISAASSTTAVAATETANSAHDRLSFMYESSHAFSLASYDENLFNNTFVLATSSSAASYSYSSPTTASSAFTFSFGNVNDSFTSNSSSLSSSASLSTFILPASTSATNASTPSAPLIEVGVNVSLPSSDDWSHFYDLILSWQGILLIFVFCTFIVITIIGNTLVIMAVITTRRLKTVTNCFVMSLAVADLLVGIFVMPPAVAVHLIGF